MIDVALYFKGTSIPVTMKVSDIPAAHVFYERVVKAWDSGDKLFTVHKGFTFAFSELVAVRILS